MNPNLANVKGLHWMRSRIPALDALSAFIEDADAPGAAFDELFDRIGRCRWYGRPNGSVVLFPYDGGPFDPEMFTIRPEGWDHEHCSSCRSRIPPMTLCYVTRPDEPYVLLCAGCYERMVDTPDSRPR